MAMTASRDNSIALTVSADHLIGRYDIKVSAHHDAQQVMHSSSCQAIQEDNVDCAAACTVHKTKHPGSSSVAIHDGGKVCAVGGWDGKCVKS